MSEESQNCSNASDVIVKPFSFPLQTVPKSETFDTTSEKVHAKISDTTSNKNCSDGNCVLFVNLLDQATESNLSMIETNKEKDQNKTVPSSPELLQKSCVVSAINNIRDKMRENELLLEKSLKFSTNFLKNLTKYSRHSDRTRKSPNILVHQGSDSDVSSIVSQESESSDIRNIFSKRLSSVSEYYTPSVSLESYSPRSTPLSGYSATPSLKSELTSDKKSALSDSLETLVTDRSPSASSDIDINNSFFYSSTTLEIRKQYKRIFSFEEFKHACYLSSNTYKRILSIKYVTLPISRILLEDLLDFVDFLNGTDVELLEPQSDQCFSTPQERKLAFVRNTFQIGIQDLENQILSELDDEIFLFKCREGNITEGTPVETVSSECSTQSCESQNAGEQSNPVISAESSIFSNLSEPSSLQFDSVSFNFPVYYPEIQNMETTSIVKSLENLNGAIKELIIPFIYKTRMVLEICMTVKQSELQLRLNFYLTEVLSVLWELVSLRKDCVILLEKCEEQIEKRIMNILKLKIKIAKVIEAKLSKLTKINSKFLSNQPNQCLAF